MNDFEWIDFYTEFANALLPFADNRKSLIEKVKQIYENTGIDLPTLEKDNNIVDIDPFTVFGLFNKHITVKNRIAISREIKRLFSISAPVPTNFDGIPRVNNMSATFYHFVDKRGKNDIDNLWTLFQLAISYADNHKNKNDFMRMFDTVISQKSVSWNITIGLFWIRPMCFLSLDTRNRRLLEINNIRLLLNMDIYGSLKKMVCADDYDWIMSSVKYTLREYNSFPELSLAAWKLSKADHDAFFGVQKESTVLPIEQYLKTSPQTTDIAKNTILYGPPGTGKTYNTVLYAVSIVENKPLAEIKQENYFDVLSRYNRYKADGLIEFTTFHQSYGYEEFIEGIKPVMDSSENDTTDIQYTIEDGLFKSFCDQAAVPATPKTRLDLGLNKNPVIWKVSLKSTGDNPSRTDCLENGYIRIGWDGYGPTITDDTFASSTNGKHVLNSFIYKMQIGDIIFSCYSSTTIDAIGVVTGEYEWCGNRFDDGLNRMRKVNWIVKNINENIVEMNGGSTMTLSTVYRLKVSLADALALIENHLPSTTQGQEKKNYVFIIDEINRGNISKIFGELITLIEPSKRIGQPEAVRVKLPYSRQLFGVPDNVYIIGTMNTADRSIDSIDTALRRRFRFREMLPDAAVLRDIFVEDISIADMLTRMNQRISVLYDREHTIGHAYFIPLREHPTLEKLAEIFENAIIPLLQEYFYEDYEKIRLVLGDNQKSDPEEQFITAVENDYSELFGSTDIGFDDSVTYEVNRAAFGNLDSYRSI